MPNRLARATSPYLRQHADNPVDWWPWGDEAFASARERDVPVFLSVGYSSCHWCHVMAHESFEDDDVAAVLNERFVSVKVDREERPDVDAVYMDATVALTGRGGWPMSVFCDHDGRPFLAGTYWPRDDRGGMPGFTRVLDAVHEAWTTDRARVTTSASQIVDQLTARARGGAGGDGPSVADLPGAVDLVVDRAWDRNLGGFGRAPKFPQAMTITWVLDHHARTGHAGALAAASHSLDAMARGGIHDQVGGGFARYSTDAHWLVPHFEKMLYDNALLVEAYATASVLDGEDARASAHARTSRRIAAYLAREMTTADGAFFAATDADSVDDHGRSEEGAFFTWSASEHRDVVAGLGLDADRFAAFHGVSEHGNWEGTTILHEPVPRERFCADRGLDPAAFADELEQVEAALYERRAGRPWPGLDDKVLTDWNGLAIRGLARAGVLLDEPCMVRQAASAATSLLGHHVDRASAVGIAAGDGPTAAVPLDLDGVAGAVRGGATIWHTSPGRRRPDSPWATSEVEEAARRPSVPAFLDDLAALASGLLALYEADGHAGWFTVARALVDRAERDFRHPDGRWTRTPVDGAAGVRHDGPDLYLATTDPYDNATPAATSLLADAAARLHALSGEPRLAELRDDLLAASGADLRRNPTAHGELARVLELVAAGPLEVAIVGPAGDARDALVAETRRHGRAGIVVAVADPTEITEAHPALLRDRPTVDGRPTAYVCRNFTCDLPVTDPAALREHLRR